MSRRMIVTLTVVLLASCGVSSGLTAFLLRPGAAGAQAPTLTAQEFVVHDSAGRVRASLGMMMPDSDDVGLTLYDDRGQMQALLAWEPAIQGGALLLREGSGTVRVVLGHTAAPSLITLFDDKGNVEWSAP